MAGPRLQLTCINPTTTCARRKTPGQSETFAPDLRDDPTRLTCVHHRRARAAILLRGLHRRFFERAHLPKAMRQIVPLPSSLKRRAPSCATATPTGRPQTRLSSMTKPVRKSSYSPPGMPSRRWMRMIL